MGYITACVYKTQLDCTKPFSSSSPSLLTRIIIVMLQSWQLHITLHFLGLTISTEGPSVVTPT